ncbi:hypothetical protein ACFQO1_12380 [Jejudonia soesokkakensis]|uniref:Uncharacterized protein n=1 Tax=Jejudonia soesokkakensis TaxID=1323432 RepID=A0ABW2MY98_9FLAO
MKKTLLLAVLAGILFTQCTDEKDPFMISNVAVGPITKDTKVMQLDSIFAQDSIVKLNPIENALGTQGEVEVYDKGGAKLLLLSPNDENDPNSKITNIQIFDDRYKTDKGLTSKSTFKDVKENYTVKSVETTIRSVVVFLENSPIYLTIDKMELPENLRYDPSVKVEASQIPDTATFKYFMIGWEADTASVEN